METASSHNLFALDIGTRSVVGLILNEQEGSYRVLDVDVEEHRERSMLDGQIHNVLEVSKTIANVKDRLETTYGPLKYVCAAAAGRSPVPSQPRAHHARVRGLPA